MSTKRAGLIKINKNDFNLAKDAMMALYNVMSLGDLEMLQKRTGDFPSSFVRKWGFHLKDTPLDLVRMMGIGHYSPPIVPSYTKDLLSRGSGMSSMVLNHTEGEIKGWLEGFNETDNTKVKGLISSLDRNFSFLKKSSRVDQEHLDDFLKNISLVEELLESLSKEIKKRLPELSFTGEIVRNRWDIWKGPLSETYQVVIPKSSLQSFDHDILLIGFVDAPADGAHILKHGRHEIALNIKNPREMTHTLRHEMVHAWQEELSLQKGARAGGPSKKPTGLVQTDFDPKWSTYILDDVEFYTLLEDHIEIFKEEHYPKIGKISDLNRAVKKYVRDTFFFEELKEYGESDEGDRGLRWKKAVKIFADEMHKAFRQDSWRRRKADFYREVTPPDQLSSFSQGTPVGRSDNPDGTNPHSALPNGDSARNIGRPSPDSPNLKYRNLDRAEANGRTPAELQDFGYVHDSGSGSARVIPYDSGFANNGSAIRKAGLIRPPQHLVEEITEIAKGALAEYLFEMEGRSSSPYKSSDLDILEGFAEDLAYLPKGIKRGEESLSDVLFEFRSAKNYLNSLKKRISDSEVISTINQALGIISELDPQDFFENAGQYKQELGAISDLFGDLFETAKSSPSLKLIGPYSREKYEEALQKNAHRRKVSRLGYSWRVDDPSLSHPLYVEVKFTSSLRANGSYGFGKTAHIITFYFDSEKTTWGVFELNKIEDVARHELVHLMQKEIAIQRHLSKPDVSPREYIETGLPRSKYDKTFRQPDIYDARDVESKKELLKSIQAQYRAEGLDPRLISIHALDDIEFYSRLLDEVTRFRKGYPQPRNKDIRSYMDRSQFFQSLKRYKPRNWKKAVGIFVSEVV